MKRNVFWIIAGAISLFTAFVHAVAGQMDLVNPMFESDMTLQMKTEWLAVWHIITVILFCTSFYLFRHGMKPKIEQLPLILMIAILYILFAFVFIICSLAMQTFAPQWILLFPIGLLALFGNRKMKVP